MSAPDTAQNTEKVREPMDVHTWFGLTYANYLVLHRTLCQSMPMEWQYRFVDCLWELHEAYGHLEAPDDFMVRAKRNGRFIPDPIPHYNRGRTYIAPNDGDGHGD